MNQVIAERKLFYSVKGNRHKKELVVCICAPYLAEEGMEEYVGLSDAVCSIKFDGLPVSVRNVHGADGIQALELAVKVVESTLEGLKEKYDFYFADGDPYFEDDEESKN